MCYSIEYTKLAVTIFNIFIPVICLTPLKPACISHPDHAAKAYIKTLLNISQQASYGLKLEQDSSLRSPLQISYNLDLTF
jgi:hypothetical protein